MHAVAFSKQYAEQVLDAIRTGKPIPVGPGGWTGHNMLNLAGILFAAVWSQGPHSQTAPGPAAAATHKGRPAEHREAVEGTLTQDMHDAIEFVTGLAFAVMDGEYDAAYEPELQAIVYREDGNRKVRAVSGFKRT